MTYSSASSYTSSTYVEDDEGALTMRVTNDYDLELNELATVATLGNFYNLSLCSKQHVKI